MSAPVLTRSLRARQCAARNDRLAASCDAKAARYPEGSALRADWLALAAEHRDTAASWRTMTAQPVTDPEADDAPCTCGGDHTNYEHDGEALLDDAADMYFDRD